VCVIWGCLCSTGRIYGSIFEKVKGSPHLKRCKLCGKLVRGRKHRFVHMPGTYSCPYCPCVYTRSDNLNAHVRVKHGKPKCPTTNNSNSTSPNSSSAPSTLVNLIKSDPADYTLQWELLKTHTHTHLHPSASDIQTRSSSSYT